jgi:hypothetical protein
MGKNPDQDFQTQGLAYSLDEGNTWVNTMVIQL